MWSAQASHAVSSSGCGVRLATVRATSSSRPAWERATPRTASRARVFGIATGTSRLNAIPTTVPIRVLTTRTSAASSGEETARISIALMGASRDCSPSRSTLANTSDAAMTIARLHHVSPIELATPTATRTPVRTAPTRTRPIWRVPTVEACTTSNAVSGAVRSTMPGETRFAIRYETTAATVSRAICADAGRIRAGSWAQDVGNDGQTHQSRLRSRDRVRPVRRPRFSRSTAFTLSMGRDARVDAACAPQL